MQTSKTNSKCVNRISPVKPATFCLCNHSKH